MNRSSVDEELIEAADENNVSEVLRLLRAGADVNVKNQHGWTPLHWAGIKGHVQVFQALREHGADIEVKSPSGKTPLHFACSYGNLPVVIELLNPNDNNGTTTTILGKRMRQGANTEAKTNQGNTPLHIAILSHHLPVLKALLSAGANILAANNGGRLPVHEAVSRRNPAVIKYLLQHAYATTRCLPLQELLQDLTWIGDSKSSDAPPLRAAFHQNLLGTDDVVEILEYLIDRNPAWLCSRDEDGSLPVHVACRRGVSFRIVQSLVNHDKASVKSVTPEGDLPLFLACEMSETSLNTIFLLIKLYPDLVYR
jgi:ankyrin repeat protein